MWQRVPGVVLAGERATHPHASSTPHHTTPHHTTPHHTTPHHTTPHHTTHIYTCIRSLSPQLLPRMLICNASPCTLFNSSSDRGSYSVVLSVCFDGCIADSIRGGGILSAVQHNRRLCGGQHLWRDHSRDRRPTGPHRPHLTSHSRPCCCCVCCTIVVPSGRLSDTPGSHLSTSYSTARQGRVSVSPSLNSE